MAVQTTQAQRNAQAKGTRLTHNYLQIVTNFLEKIFKWRWALISTSPINLEVVTCMTFVMGACTILLHPA